MGKFEVVERGAFKGDIIYKRDVPELNLSSKRGKFVLAVVWLSGWIIAFIIGGIIGIIVWGITGSVFYGWFCVYLALAVWFVLLSFKTYREVRYRKNFMRDDVEFMPVERIESIGERCMNLIDKLNPADYFIAYSRSYWAEYENEPFRNVEDWGGAFVHAYHREPSPEYLSSALGQITKGGMRFGYAVGSGLVYWLRKKLEPRKFDPEWVLDEIAELSGGVPMPPEIAGVFKSEYIPGLIDKFGERVAKFYLAFLFGPCPILPYSSDSSEDELRAVAESNDLETVITHIKRTIS